MFGPLHVSGFVEGCQAQDIKPSKDPGVWWLHCALCVVQSRCGQKANMAYNIYIYVCMYVCMYVHTCVCVIYADLGLRLYLQHLTASHLNVALECAWLLAVRAVHLLPEQWASDRNTQEQEQSCINLDCWIYSWSRQCQTNYISLLQACLFYMLLL